MTEMCHQIEERFAEVGDDLFDEAQYQEHVAGCDNCTAVFAALQEVDAMLPQLSRPESPEVDTTAILAAASESAMHEDWYAAIGEEQRGPMGHQQLEDLWRRGAIGDETMIWRPGFDDWMAVADVPELAYLLTESSPPTPAADATTEPVEASEGPAWKPSAASALEELVQGEIEPAEPKAAPQSDAALPAGLPPGLGSVDLFGGSSGDAFASRASLPAAPMPWAAPAPRAGGLRPWHWVAAGLGSSMIGALVVAVIFVTQPQVAPAPAGPSQTALATEGAQPVAVEAELPAKEAPKPIVAPAVPAGEGADASPEAADETTGEVTPEPRSSRTTGRRTKRGMRKGGKAKSVATPAVEKPTPAGSGNDALPAQLTPKDIVKGVKANANELMPCIKNARVKGELVPGTYKLILQWTVLPNGTVTNSRMTGPAQLLGTSLPGCVAARLRSWKFPESQRESPVKNFPFGPFTVK